jgi:uncharacterized protein
VLTTLAPSSSLPEGHPAYGKVQAKRGNGGTPAATAYVCRAMTCSLPITEAAGLAVALDHV